MARTKDHYDETKEKLVRLSLQQFIENGYENTTITDIMRAAELSKGGMYHYFSSKEDILEEVIDYGLRQEIDHIQENLNQLPIEEQLIYFIQYNNFSEFTNKLLRYREKEGQSMVAYRIREKNIAFCIPVLTTIFEKGTAAGIYSTNTPKVMAELFMLMTKAVLESHYLPEATVEERKDRMAVSLQLFQNSLHPSQPHFEQIEELFYSLIGESG